MSAKLHPEIARYIAEEHRRCERFYRDSKSDPANINTALMVMHADTAAIYEKVYMPKKRPKRKPVEFENAEYGDEG